MEGKHFHYTMSEDPSNVTSPPSDRLVICTENDASPSETIQQGTNLQPNQAPVIQPQQDNRFSMASLLRPTDHAVSNSHSVFELEPSLNEGHRSFPQLPSIHEAFILYAETSLADTLDRMLDYVQPSHLTLPHNNVQMVQPVLVTTANTTSESTNRTSNKMPPMTLTEEKASGLEKPPYVYVGIIIMAIHNSPEKMMTLHEVRDKLKEWFPFFRGAYTGWRDSVRHCLSDSKCFSKIKHDPKSRCHFWLINYQEIKPSYLLRQNRRSVDVALYKYYLHEELGLPPIQIPSDKHGDKHIQLKLPAKPAIDVTDSSSTASVCGDLPFTRNDDAMSECNDPDPNSTMKVPTTITTSEPSSSEQQKRKLETSGTQQDENPKRRKTAAVNPTFSTNTSASLCTIPEPTKSSATSSANYPSNSQSVKTVKSNTNHATNNTPYQTSQFSNQQAGYQPDLFPGGYHVTPYSTLYPSAPHTYGHQWPYNTDPSVYNMYPSSNLYYGSHHGYQNYDIQQQYSAATAPARSHHGYLNNDSYNWYLPRQMSDPSCAPVNLCKTDSSV